jgi:BASS family bile acid:Na+ symporter
MVRMLLLVIFAPLFAALAIRRFGPAALPHLERVQFFLVLTMFMLINLGVFARYAGFLRAHFGQVMLVLLVCCVLALISAGAGFFLGRLSCGRLSGLDGAVLTTYINNVLIVVFAARFFGPTEPLLAAAYLLPLYVMLLPIRWASRYWART